MGKLNEFLSQVDGYFREGEEDNFPWEETRKTVWYALLTIEENKIKKYGFTAAKGQKYNLFQALKKIEDKTQAMLIGVWTGSHSTHLFVLDIEKAIDKLEKLQ